MKVRIVTASTRTLEGVSLTRFHPGQVYDLPPTMAAYLVAEGIALIEMRKDPAPIRIDGPDRRQAK